MQPMPTLSKIAVYPVKSLDPVDLDRVSITGLGGLAGDRVYAMVTENGDYVNGKLTADVHRLCADIDLESNRVILHVRGEDPVCAFHLEQDREELETWLSDYFGLQIELKVGSGGSLTDSVVYSEKAAAGPTLISAATIREVASWYDGIDSEEMCLRLRPNLIVAGVPPFWEDKLVAAGGRRVRIGTVTLEGHAPVPRCVVPTRDPYTGETYDGFREVFLEKRDATLPEWADRDVFDGNLFSLMAVTRIPEPERDGELRTGDSVHLVDSVDDQ